MKKIALMLIICFNFTINAQVSIPENYSSFCMNTGGFFNDWLSIDLIGDTIKFNSRLAGNKYYLDEAFLNLENDDYSIELSVPASKCEIDHESSPELLCDEVSAIIELRNSEGVVTKKVKDVTIKQEVISEREITLSISQKNSNDPFITITNNSCF